MGKFTYKQRDIPSIDYKGFRIVLSFHNNGAQAEISCYDINQYARDRHAATRRFIQRVDVMKSVSGDELVSYVNSCLEAIKRQIDTAATERETAERIREELPKRESDIRECFLNAANDADLFAPPRQSITDTQEKENE